MSDAPTTWYRSLYWRLALGLIGFLALMLAAEGALFLWVTDRIAGSMPARSPLRLAVLVASDVAAAVDADPALDIQHYVNEQYNHVFQTFLVVMRDGRVVANHDDVPPEMLEAARDLARRPFGPRPRGFGGPRPEGGGFRGDGGFREGDGSFRGGGGFRGNGEFEPRDGGTPDRDGRRAPGLRVGESAPILVSGMPIGRVVVLPEGPPFSRVATQLGPTVGLVAGGVFAVGTTLVALLVFGPARRRLRQVQDATERLGSGDLAARAPDQGGDEVAAMARSFNRMADELTSRTAALEASDKARRQLLADVSHELMTPLTAMRGYIETLGMSDLRIDADTRERYLGIVNEETHRLERIIGDLLDMARLEGGGTTMRRERVEVEQLFERVAARHERELSARHVRLTHDVEPRAEHITGDPDRLEQVLQNLAANALRHTPDGGEISMRASAVADGIRIVVRDTGPGIPPDHLPLIFDRFYKADAARKAAGGGSGLGLSIVKAIVERHGGTISARNENGAVFEITLPHSWVPPSGGPGSG